MHVIRLLPVIFSTILFAAHVLRTGNNIFAFGLVILLATLYIKQKLVMRIWQGILVIFSLLWINVTAGILQLRMDTGMPWKRMLVIMAFVMLFTAFSALWMEKKTIKSYYGFNEKTDAV